jgi:hypothetical protein
MYLHEGVIMGSTVKKVARKTLKSTFFGLDKVKGAISPELPDIKMPEQVTADAAKVVDDSAAAAVDRERRKRGRASTVLTAFGSASMPRTATNVLLGGG